MALDLNLQEQELLADTFQRRGFVDDPVPSVRPRCRSCFRVRCRRGRVVDRGTADAVAVVPAAICLVVLAVATRVRFDMPFGFTVPIQLAFVPLLFAVPLALVPSQSWWRCWPWPADVFARAMRRSRLLLGRQRVVCNRSGCRVRAPRTEPRQAGAALLLAALAAQFAVDFAASSLRYASVGAEPSEQLRESWVYAIDAGLSGLGLVVAE